MKSQLVISHYQSQWSPCSVMAHLYTGPDKTPILTKIWRSDKSLPDSWPSSSWSLSLSHRFSSFGCASSCLTVSTS
jgi:hypothetical protein